ncbi:DUF4148 domain-containing protein [Paraburkholderia flava]|uniref:DUF4148 domain-containing protein n=1 Tax=Paraburkholderia flava TaxID=2547393 RepID=UPI00105FE3AF|nr:DUF4148 domain-containing protein [Paraburkholderia flava]
MKTRLVVSVVALALAPAIAFAQSHSTITRAQVRAELTELQQAGYRGDTEASYPTKLMEAESRVANGSVQSVEAPKASGVGGRAAGSSASGARGQGATDDIPGLKSIYFGS